jgi:Fur family transcriptional regulator, zinc uptake regulator
MSVHEILEAVRWHGIFAPPTVYRALSQLIDKGPAHRLESVSFWIACIEPGRQHESAIFIICSDCGSYEELRDTTALKRLHAKASERNFKVDNTMLENTGECADCRRPWRSREHQPSGPGSHWTSFKEIDGAPE